MLKLKTFKGGYDGNFSYILYDEESKEAVIIDTSIKPELLLQFITENYLKLEYVVIMHSHFDHLVGYEYYREQGIRLAASEKIRKEVDLRLKDNDELHLGNHTLKILHTPGHLYDTICILAEGKLFTSDTLFIGCCGRTDLAGADKAEMQRSLRRISSLPDETIIYPGHDYGKVPLSTLKEQKKSNPYLAP